MALGADLVAASTTACTAAIDPPGQDQVIPSAVTDAILENRALGGNVEQIILPEAGRALATETTVNAARVAQLTDHCHRFVNDTSLEQSGP